MLTGLFTLTRTAADPASFVAFWSACYRYPDEGLYWPNLSGTPTPAKLKALFEWKVGRRFFKHQWPAIERTFISRLDEAMKLPADVSAEQALSVFPDGGAVYRIFWLHCLRPDRFPIYDMHVHRAMNLIEGTPHRELAKYASDKAKVALYIDRYLPF